MLNYLKSFSSNLLWIAVVVSLMLVLVLILSNARIIQTGQTPEQTQNTLNESVLTTTPLYGEPSMISTPTPVTPDIAPIYVGTPPTATPYPGEIRPADMSTPTPTHTPLPISKTIDLAKELPDEDKIVYIVRRSNNTYEKYLLPPDGWENREKLMGLGPQDVIIRSFPLIPLPPSTPVMKPTGDSSQ